MKFKVYAGEVFVVLIFCIPFCSENYKSSFQNSFHGTPSWKRCLFWTETIYRCWHFGAAFYFLGCDCGGLCVYSVQGQTRAAWFFESLRQKSFEELGALLYSVTWTHFCFVSILDTQRSALFLRDMSNHRRSQGLFINPQQVAKGIVRVLEMLLNLTPQIIVGMWRDDSYFSPCISRLTWLSSWCRDIYQTEYCNSFCAGPDGKSTAASGQERHSGGPDATLRWFSCLHAMIIIIFVIISTRSSS